MEISVPEDLTDVTDEALQDLLSQITESASALSDDPAGNADVLENLAAGAVRIRAEVEARAEVAAERTARGDSALAQITGEAPEAEVTDEAEVAEPEAIAASADGPGESDDDETAEEEVAPEAAEPEAEPQVEEAPAEAEVDEATTTVDEEAVIETTAEETPSEPPAEAPAADADTTEGEAALSTTEPEDLAVTTQSTPSTTGSLSALRDARPAAADPVTEEENPSRPSARMLATTDAFGVKGDAISRDGLAQAIANKHRQWARVGGVMDPVVLATHKVEWPEAQMLRRDEIENFGIISGIATEAQSLVASGGSCAPLAPSYDFWRQWEAHSPVEAAIPVLGAPRGGVRYIEAVGYGSTDLGDAAAGIRVTTEAQDAAGYTTQDPAGTTAPKPCTSVECPDVLEATVDVVSKCVTFGNLNYRVFPEQVEDFLARLDAHFAETKEVFYLDGIDAGSVDVDITPPYGANRGLTYALALAAHGYRKRNRMSLNAPLDVLVPDTVVPFLKVDLVNDHALGMNFLGASQDQVAAEMFRQFNLNVTFFYDAVTADGAASNLGQAQAAGGLNPFPTEYPMFIFAPGTWVRLDLGVLDLGIVRDSTLNSTNDLQIFSEQWIQIVKVGLESVRLNVTLCPDGGGPDVHDLLACAS